MEADFYRLMMILWWVDSISYGTLPLLSPLVDAVKEDLQQGMGSHHQSKSPGLPSVWQIGDGCPLIDYGKPTYILVNTKIVRRGILWRSPLASSGLTG